MQNKKITKILILAAVVILFATVTGCSILSYFKKKDVDSAAQYKSKIEKNYNQASMTAQTFDKLVKKLSKHYYTPEDFTDPDGLVMTANSIKSEVDQSIQKLNTAKTAAVKFGQTATGQKYSAYLSAKNQSIDNLSKALEEDKKVLDVLLPAYADFQTLFTYVDSLKKSQSSNITAASIGISRMFQERENQNYYEILIQSEAIGSAASASTTSSSTTDTSTTTTTTTETTSTSGSETEEVPDWIFTILQNKYQSGFYVNFLKKQESKLDSIYTDVFEIDKKIEFKETGSMVNAVEKIRNDISDLRESTEELRDNLITQAKQNRLLDKLENRENALESSENSLQYNISNPPSSVTSNSAEMEGYRASLKTVKEDLSETRNEIKAVKNELKNLRTAEDSRLRDAVNDDWWRYGGALLKLIDLNKGVNRNIMREIVGWKNNKIGKYIRNHNYYTKLAKYQSARAGMEFDEINKRLALL